MTGPLQDAYGRTIAVCPTCTRAHLGPSKTPPGGVLDGEGWLLYGLVRTLRPRVVVELGRGRGASTMFLARGVADNASGQVWSLDLSDGDEVRCLLGSEGLDGPVILCSFSTHGHEAEVLSARLAEVDFLFVDAGHAYADIQADAALWLPRLSERGIAVFHDATRWGVDGLDVSQFLESGGGLDEAVYPGLTFGHDMGYDAGGPHDNGLRLVQRRPLRVRRPR
jgi:hypothetical protein